MKIASLSAFVAAGLLAGGLAVTSANAADLGGNCCADLEERIAELEGDITRLRAERQPTGAPMETLIQHLNTRPADAQEQALHRLTETLVKEPNNVKALFELGNTYERQGMYEQAIQEYRQALTLDPDFVDAIEHLAFLLEKLNRDHEASPLWERILSLKKHA